MYDTCPVLVCFDLDSLLSVLSLIVSSTPYFLLLTADEYVKNEKLSHIFKSALARAMRWICFSSNWTSSQLHLASFGGHFKVTQPP
jgi:hypothetical protein